MRILVVEDEPKMAELIRKGLEREHYSALTTGSGPDGLALALASPFNAIVLDVMLPGSSGCELAGSGIATPILFLTARDTDCLAGCAPALPASASPAASEYAVT